MPSVDEGAYFSMDEGPNSVDEGGGGGLTSLSPPPPGPPTVAAIDAIALQDEQFGAKEGRTGDAEPQPGHSRVPSEVPSSLGASETTSASAQESSA